MAARGAWVALRSVVKPCIAGSLLGLTVSDRYFSLAAVRGASMHPTFEGRTGEYALVERSPERYDYSRGEIVVFVSPVDHRSKAIKRVIGLPGDWISVPETEEIRKIPEGHCWVEGDNGSFNRDLRAYGPIKGQNDLKVLAEGSTKSYPDHLNVLNSRTSKLNEMSLVVSVCPEQVQADVRQLHGDIFRVLTKGGSSSAAMSTASCGAIFSVHLSLGIILMVGMCIQVIDVPVSQSSS